MILGFMTLSDMSNFWSVFCLKCLYSDHFMKETLFVPFTTPAKPVLITCSR